MTINSEVTFKKNEIDLHHNNNIQNKLEIIEEETNKYVEDLKKGTYNILVNINLTKGRNKGKASFPQRNRKRRKRNYQSVRQKTANFTGP